MTLGIRPEFVTVARLGNEGLPARVERLEFLGSEVIVYCRLDAIGETMVAKVTPAEGADLSPGVPVRLTADARHIFVFSKDGARLAAAPLSSIVTREALHG